MKIEELNSQSKELDFWSNPEQARKSMQEMNNLEQVYNKIKEIEKDLSDLIEFMELAEEEEGKKESLFNEIEISLQELKKRVEKQEIEALFQGETDHNDCFIEIHPGAGGTEAQDWAAMLARMYIRWANTQGYKSELIEELVGEEAGIKSASYLIKGKNAFGWLKTESGVHRLVRISPFDSGARRHTSFASVWVYPKIDQTIEIEINEKECRLDTYRASGAGGQHVNKTDSAVRITHIPTGIVVQCQNDRSQHKNRATAWDMLRARLYEYERQRQEKALQTMQDQKSEIGWGQQIRSYVLQPYQMVKDLRTQIETSNTQSVLDGDLNAFMIAALSGLKQFSN